MVRIVAWDRHNILATLPDIITQYKYKMDTHMPGDTSPRTVRFLLVEDDADHAELVRRAIKDNRIANELTHVSDAQQAFQMLKQEPPYTDFPRPDVVLLDLKLPRMSGLELLDAIKRTPELSSIPVVVMTTSAAEADRTSAYTFNANSYLVKPLDFDRFRQMVHDLQLYWSVWNLPASDSTASTARA